jgi:ABC-type branched-subunit amino acid transport system substrate-binding protein
MNYGTILLILLVNSYQIAFIGSDDSVFFVVSEYFQSQSIVLNRYQSYSDFTSFEFEDLSLIIDSTQIDLVHQGLANYSSFYSVPLVIFGSGICNDWTFYTDYSLECQTSAIVSTLAYFDVLDLGVLWSYSSRNKNLLSSIQEFLTRALCINVGNANTTAELSKLFIKTLKANAVQNFLFLGDSTYCSLYEKSFSSAYLEKKGNFGIYLDECIYQVFDKGALILASQKTAQATSYSDYILKALLPYLVVFENKGLSNYQIKKLYSRNLNDCKYSLVNVQPSGKTVVGSIINGNVSITKSILYYGGGFNRTIYTQPLITISANTGYLNPPGYPNAYQNANYMQGTYFAVNKINKEKTLIPNYFLELYDQVNCGVSIFVANFSKECFLSNIDSMGIAYIPTHYPITPGVLNQFKSLNIAMPFVAGLGSSNLLSSMSQYPNYVRIVSPSQNFGIAWSHLINIFGWKKIVIFYTKDAFAQPVYEIVANLSSTYDYEIVNSEQYRCMPYVTTTDGISKFTDGLLDALNTGCNIFFLAMTDPTSYFVLEGLYNLGVRRGNLTFFILPSAGSDAINSNGGDPMKRAELMHGSFVVFNVQYFGDYGKSIEKEFLKTWNNSWMRSFNMDAVFTIASNVNFLLQQGKSYENNTEFMNAIRSIRFQGVSGMVAFDHTSNDRNAYHLGLYNIYQDNVTNLWIKDIVSLISPFGSVYYTTYKVPVWPSGSFPEDMKSKYLNCPFQKNQIQDSVAGRNIKMGVSGSLFVLAALLTFYVSKKIEFKSKEMMKSKVYASFEDYLTLGFIFIEGIQISAIGPRLSSVNNFLQNLCELFSLNLSSLNSFRDSNFWTIFYFSLGIGYSWIFLILIGISSTYFHLVKIENKVKNIKKLFTNIMSNYFFIPIETVLISIVMCDKASGPNFNQIYSNYDCNQICWNTNYLYKTVPAFFLALAYVPTAIYFGVIWREKNTLASVKGNNLNIVIKRITYVLLIFIEKNLKIDYSLAYAIIFECVIVSLLVFTIVTTPFNFDRANLWEKVCIGCIAWNSFICILSILISVQEYIWLIIQLFGLVLIIAIGCTFHSKLPQSLLVVHKARSIVHLFRFAFGYEDLRPITLPTISNIGQVSEFKIKESTA